MAPTAVLPYHSGATGILMSLHDKVKAYAAYVMVPAKMGTATTICTIGILWAFIASGILFLMRRIGFSTSSLEATRRVCLWPLRLGARLVLYCLGFWYIKTSGTPCSKSEARIIVSNHCSVWEIIYLFWMYGPSFVSRIENQQITGMSSILSLCSTIFVDRSSDRSRSLVLKQIRDAATSNDTPQICIFPEGTTTSGKSLAAFKIGAFHTGQTIQPVVFRFPWRYHDPTWPSTGETTIFSMLVGMYSQYSNTMEVTYLPSYTPSDEEMQNATFFANNVRERMLQHVK